MNENQKIISVIQFQFPAIAWCLFIFIASSIPSDNIAMLPGFTDKVVHASVFGVLCWLSHVALFHQDWKFIRRHSLFIAVCFVVLYGMSDEYHQSFTPGRSTDPYDLLADTVGGLIYAAVALRFKLYQNE